MLVSQYLNIKMPQAVIARASSQGSNRLGILDLGFLLVIGH
ncbi:hypothetical protein COO91_04364 [Nostoc flagelliforme CCNUN1]|uniref:Uncharacterized protein n=1 Tax=Nostoc flagelliforme CCNUN1 TaxID=2038116 RepID=A0A2K8SSC8_9NOSO|nr:hypothetical protein COO91_04364 [Nostoc flagelliforme CCNUN1]